MKHLSALISVATLVFVPATAFAGRSADKQTQFLKALDTMMIELGPQTAKASATVRKEYRAYLDLLVLSQYEALEDALYTGGLVPLPGAAEEFNVKVRTDGMAPIAEKDLGNQSSYIAARPATIGMLLEIASRVSLGPLEITSLVRHSEYQDELRTTNSNANTSVPMHTMGLAFDVALVNTPLQRVYEIRDVLGAMQKAGDILVVGERKQLVFHVVPHPSRLGYFTDVYARAAARSFDVITSTELDATLSPYVHAVVETEIVGFRPTDEIAEEWWAADGAPSDVTVQVLAASIGRDDRSFVGRLAARCVAFIADLVLSARNVVTRA